MKKGVELHVGRLTLKPVAGLELGVSEGLISVQFCCRAFYPLL